MEREREREREGEGRGGGGAIRSGNITISLLFSAYEYSQSYSILTGLYQTF